MINIWIAPILSFTAEEVYKHTDDNNFESVFLEEWQTHDFSLSESEKEIGELLFSLKGSVAKKLDEARNQEIIGSSLDATIYLNVDEKIYEMLDECKDELKFIFISSDCILQINDSDNDVEILVKKNDNLKCERCWHKNESVGTIEGHPGLCMRCHDNIFSDGEKRKLG